MDDLYLQAIFPVLLTLTLFVFGLLYVTRSSSSNATSENAKQKSLRKYTEEEVASHNKPDDCWLIIDGKVYDVTEYVDEHPGGKSILNNAGLDSTKGFNGPQHPSRVFDHVGEYYIGDVSIEE